MHSRTGQQASYGLQVYTHHFVTVDTLMVPPPTGQGLMVRPAFTEQHRLLVPANMLESEISRYHHCTKSGIFGPSSLDILSAGSWARRGLHYYASNKVA